MAAESSGIHVFDDHLLHSLHLVLLLGVLFCDPAASFCPRVFVPGALPGASRCMVLLGIRVFLCVSVLSFTACTFRCILVLGIRVFLSGASRCILFLGVYILLSSGASRYAVILGIHLSLSGAFRCVVLCFLF